MTLLKVLKKLRPVVKPLEFVGKRVALVINFLLLSLTYFTAVAATALAARTFRKRFLELKTEKTAKTYWIVREKEDNTSKDSYRGF